MKMTILIIALLIGGLLLVAGCAGNGGTAAQVNNTGSPAGQGSVSGGPKPGTNSSASIWSNPFFTSIPAPLNAIPETASVDANGIQTINMTADNFVFSPNTITVKKGVKVRIRATSLDVEHSMAIPGLRINVDMPVGRTMVVEFTPNETGSFPFRCAVMCGAGHRSMTGSIVVTE